MNNTTKFVVLIAAAVAASFIGVVLASGISDLISGEGDPHLTAENVARFYVAGSTGIDIKVVDKVNASDELGAVEAYKIAVTPADGSTEDVALVYVAKTNAGGWLVVQPEEATKPDTTSP